MHSAIVMFVIFATGCVSATASVRGAGSVDHHGEPGAVAVGSLGAGYTINRSSTVALDVDVGSALGAPLLVGESVSYTRLHAGGGWRVGVGASRAVLDDESHVRPRVFGEYLISVHTTRRGPRASRCLNDKGCLDDLFPSPSYSSYWAVGIGPELFADFDDETAIGLGLGVRLAWLGLWGGS